MKKITFSLLIVLLFPLVVLAEDPKVLTLDAKSNNDTISFNGTIEDGSYAVMCKLLNSNDEAVGKLSVEVDDNSFLGELTAPKTGDYTVSCANYEGGEIKTVSVKAQVEKTTSEVPKTPQTLDNLFKYISLLIISILGLSFITLKTLKNKMN